jgi:putative ABC transport system permease protein
MTRINTHPPSRAERLLARALGSSDWTESILGDLHEEHARRAARSGIHAASWYWMEAVALSSRAIAARLRRPTPLLPAMPPPAPGDSVMRTIGFEIRYGIRSILKRPALSATVVLTLALGLGANAAVFEQIDALILRPFTMRDVDRITMLSYTRQEELDRREGVSPADFLDWKKQATVYEHLAAFQWWTANLVGRDEPENVQGFWVSADFFPALGVAPAIGRGFMADEETIGRDHRVILGHDLWQRRFAGDRAIVGRPVNIDGEDYEVVGIAPAGFDFPMGSQLWAPLAFKPSAASNRRAQYLTVIGRLAPGKTLQDAKAQMSVIGERLNRDYPDTNRGREARVYTLSDGMMDLGVGPILSMCYASACFVLLIACANVASLVLARGAERRREIAVRLAIGASRTRIVRELLIESALLSVAAVPAALGVAWISLKLMVAYMPPKIARFVIGWYTMDVDARLVAFTCVLALVTGVVFGLVPALQVSRPKIAESLKEGSRTSGKGRSRLRRGLVIAEIALALPLLVASALSVLTVYRFLNGPQGFEPQQLLTMELVLASGRYSDDEAYRRFATTAVDRLKATPGIQYAAAVNIMPAASNNSGSSVEIEGQPNPDPANPPSVDFRAMTPDLFTALQLPLMSGRGFTDADREDTQPVAIVSQSLVRKFFPDADPIGRRIKVGVNGKWVTIVGVCGDYIHNWFARRNAPTLYQPFRQAPSGQMALVMRTTGAPSTVVADARAAVRAVDPAQAVFDLRPMRDTLWERTLGLQYVGAIMLVFGMLALVLATVGVYGVMAYMVTQRTQEFGLRIALGATRRDVLRLAVGQTGRLTVIGVSLGILLSLALSRLIEAGLVGVASADPRIVGVLAVTLVAAALAAGYLPARRAASIDPMVAFRAE